MNKKTLVLGGVLLALIVLAYAYHGPLKNWQNNLGKPKNIFAKIDTTKIDKIEITSTADVPAGTGMGSSGSYLVGLLKGLQTLTRRGSGVQELAELACHIEIDLLKARV